MARGQRAIAAHARLAPHEAGRPGSRVRLCRGGWTWPDAPPPPAEVAFIVPRRSPGRERIQAALLALNAADDERKPPETGIMERELKLAKNGRLFLIPASEDTRGHGTTGMAKFFAKELQEFLAKVLQRAKRRSS
jgi:hypothetical protein